jgi:hypothetical protein
MGARSVKMRAIFGIVSLLVVLAIVGVLAQKQLSSAPAVPGTTAGATPQAQSEQVQQQVKQSVEATLQQARPAAEEK